MEDPPGTTRTPSAAEKSRGGKVCLSTNEKEPAVEFSRAPKRKPSRMPCLTQALTRHPVGAAASGSAERTSPRSRHPRNSRKAFIAAGSLLAAAPAAKCRAISSSSWGRFIPIRVEEGECECECGCGCEGEGEEQCECRCQCQRG